MVVIDVMVKVVGVVATAMMVTIGNGVSSNSEVG